MGLQRRHLEHGVHCRSPSHITYIKPLLLTVLQYQAWELAEGKVLFDGCPTPKSPYAPESHLAQMIALLGQPPKELLAEAENSKYFDSEGAHLLAPQTDIAQHLPSNTPYPVSNYSGF